MLQDFPVTFLLMISGLILLWLKNTPYIILVLKHLLRFIYGPDYSSFCCMFCGYLKRLYFAVFGAFYKLISWTLLIDGFVELYNLVRFLSSSVSCHENGVEVFRYNWVFLCLFNFFRF